MCYFNIKPALTVSNICLVLTGQVIGAQMLDARTAGAFGRTRCGWRFAGFEGTDDREGIET